MSLKPAPIGPIPEETVRVAHRAFPKDSVAIRLRDEFGSLYQDQDFQVLFPTHGQPGLAPWRLALVTVLPFLEHLILIRIQANTPDPIKASEGSYRLGIGFQGRES